MANQGGGNPGYWLRSPPHQRQLSAFRTRHGIAASERASSPKWSQVDLERRTAWIHADEAKAREAIGVPLNDEAMAVPARGSRYSS